MFGGVNTSAMACLMLDAEKKLEDVHSGRTFHRSSKENVAVVVVLELSVAGKETANDRLQKSLFLWTHAANQMAAVYKL